MKVPIYANARFNDIYFVSYNEETKTKQYEIIKSFRDYFYTSDYNQPILPKDKAIKRSVDKSYMKRQMAKEHTNIYEGDIPFHYRFLIDTYKEHLTLPQVPIRVGFWDIENINCGKIDVTAPMPITAISIKDSVTKLTYTFAWHETEQYKDAEQKIAVYKTEEEMLKGFLALVNAFKYDVLIGWNTDKYDTPYLCNRLARFGLMDQLSPFGKVEKHYRDENKFIVYGISMMDYLVLYKKYNLKELPSYKLDSVAKKEKLAGKTEFDGDLDNLWRTDIKKFLEYNRQDVNIVFELENKKKFITLIDEIKRIGLVNFEDGLQNTVIIDNLLTRYLNNQGLIVHSKSFTGKNEDFEKILGAYVKPPKPGIYEWIIDDDYEALYPTLIRFLGISPDTKVGKVINWKDYVNEQNDFDIPTGVTYKVTIGNNAKDMTKEELFAFVREKNYSLSANGIMFDKAKKGIFPAMLDWIVKMRKEYKKTMLKYEEAHDELNADVYNSKQLVMKTLLNSFYGFLAFSSSRYFDPDLGEAVTISGQKAIRNSAKFVQEKGYGLIYVDTDSLFLTHPEINSEESGRAKGLEISNLVNEYMKELCLRDMNADSLLFIKQEFVNKRGIFFAKKRYVLWQVNKEGISKDTIDYKGIDVVRNSTPPFAREYLEKIYNVALRENDKEKVFALADEFRNSIYSRDVNDIGIRSSLTKAFSEYKKNLPLHVRGAKVWEDMFAKEKGVSFINENKGKCFFMKELPELGLDEKTYKALKKKGIVIMVPDGSAFPFDPDRIDYKRMEDRLVDKPLKALLAIYKGEEVEIDEDEDSDE